MKLFISWIIYAIAIGITSYLLPGIFINSITAILVLAVVLGAINTFVRPILVVLTLPLSIMTLGLFIVILNTLLIMLAGAIVPGVIIANFWWALAFGLVLALIHGFLKKFQD